jgi:hypothetical protein
MYLQGSYFYTTIDKEATQMPQFLDDLKEAVFGVDPSKDKGKSPAPQTTPSPEGLPYDQCGQPGVNCEDCFCPVYRKTCAGHAPAAPTTNPAPELKEMHFKFEHGNPYRVVVIYGNKVFSGHLQEDPSD